ncbi:hypothetical protein K443DRAFT_445659 [Laccaria amethystina LaAM-08-1]|uniref:Unplaced genomic scaffold K443scaffold_398, whole genome shotgun sequence n=1 Tax=Laccaria amethystina LaAM-08-1 TaxID=1095629 RepID=A0A0C9WUG2_9AGAR|nr:hypothetical protein K443DRAFT_445659 [Laccaria amethystina LaAM-08-1]
MEWSGVVSFNSPLLSTPLLPNPLHFNPPLSEQFFFPPLSLLPSTFNSPFPIFLLTLPTPLPLANAYIFQGHMSAIRCTTVLLNRLIRSRDPTLRLCDMQKGKCCGVLDSSAVGASFKNKVEDEIEGRSRGVDRGVADG